MLETYGDDYGRHYRSFDIAAELESVSDLDLSRQLSSSQILKMSKASFVEWSFTSTKMQDCIRNVGQEKMRGHLAELVELYFAGEMGVAIAYETELFIARRE